MVQVKGSYAWTPGELLQLVRQQRATSRSSMARITGLSPSTIATRVEGLLEHGFLTEDAEQSDRGRKPRTLSVDNARGVIAAIDIGSSHTRIGFVDLGGALLAVTEHPVRHSRDAADYFAWLARQVRESLDTEGTGGPEWTLRGAGVSIASPVDRATGRLVHPIHLDGWNALDPAQLLSDSLGVPAIVDNDATLMALAEHRMHYPDVTDLLYVKLGSAIGAGLVIGGSVYSGRSGGAGEIGHLPTDAGRYARACQCGRTNCLEACFGGAAIREHAGVFDEGEVHRDAGAAIGDAIGTLSNILNPELVVIGGRLSQNEQLMHSVRAALYARALPVAADGLILAPSRNGPDGSILGAAWQVLDVLLSAESVNAELSAEAA